MFQRRVHFHAATMMLAAAAICSAPVHAQAPAESMMVVRVDVAGVVGSALYKQLVAQMGDKMSSKDAKYLEFKEATGFNPEADLKSFTLGIAGELGAPNPKMYAILEGKFDQAKIEAYAKGKTDKFTVADKGGLTTFTPIDKDGGNPPPTFAILNATTMVAAGTDEFDALVASAKGGGSVPAAKAINDLLAGASGKGQIHMAMMLPEQAKEQMKANPQSAALANIQSVLFSMNVTDGVDLLLHAAADNEANGKNVYDAFNGFVAMGKMMSAEQPEAQKVLNDLKLEQQGAATQLSLSIKAEDVSKLMAQAMAMSGGGAPPAGGEAGSAAPSGNP